MLKKDPIKNVLYVDLTKRDMWIEDKSELFEKYLGGAGVAINLLEKECPIQADALGPDNPAIFAVGQLNALYPLASKTVAMFKSPLTGNLGESHCGGRSSIAIRMAGYGAIVIKGTSETPVYLSIHDDKVKLRDASTLWGLQNDTVGRVLREQEAGAGTRSIMRIGRAGEEMVSYSTLTVETYRHFGRLGLGTVFGSKKLKALVISGKQGLKLQNWKLYKKLYDELFESATTSGLMKKYHDIGTPINVKPLSDKKLLPTKNLQQGYLDEIEEISGETFAKNFLGRRMSCAHCPVSCVHLATLKEAYTEDPYFHKTKNIGYDYELIFSLGSMLGITSAKQVLQIIDEVEALGFDAMSVGVVLSWATEMMEKGLITTKETNGLKLQWNDSKTYIKALRLIVNQPNDFFKALARGVIYAASKYGGKNFALAFGKNEMPGYHTGPAYVGYLIGARHSHLDNGGYALGQKASEKQLTPKQLVEKLVTEEVWRQIMSSLVICFFARGIYKPEMVVDTLRTVGYDLTPEDLNKIGKEILKKKHEFKIREGFNIDREVKEIPQRIFETPAPVPFDINFIKESVETFKNKLKEL